ncbi:hypothetical protein AVEN_202094-1 [Araneus ventricosus]|uniref:Uncharacterized protein n=1 Tax=Araneus ventricosus TaxID=182803 RepID=A0A4Y2QUQ5_ARAVE|nr:hypothetical protein AVEN_202094-1 [Araneus ventricosus]
MPKQKCGNTNDGDTVRKFFRHPEETAEITKVELNLIKRLGIILECINCNMKINLEEFAEFTRVTRDIYLRKHSWYPMPMEIVEITHCAPDGNIRLVKLKTKSGEILRPTLRLYPLEVSEHEKELFQKCEPPVKYFTCDVSSTAERDSLQKAEPYESTSRYGRKLKRVKKLLL